MPQTPDSVRTFIDTLRRIDLASAVDILLIALLIYAVLLWLKGTTGMTVIRGAAMLIVAGLALGSLLNLTVVNWLLRNSVPALLVAVPIVFQPEIRRALERVGRTRVAARRQPRASERLLVTLAHSAAELSALGLGALIVIERETGLDEFLPTGTPVDASASTALLVNIFWRNAPLHDGAVIVRDNRIAAAGCTLPLSESRLPGHLGTRHRAALGMSERGDAVIIVVSEETGAISLVLNGQFAASGLDEEQLLDYLRTLLGQPEGATLRVLQPPLPRRTPFIEQIDHEPIQRAGPN